VTPAQIISRKRDGIELSEEEIEDLIRQYADDHLPDYQMSAFAMAVYFQGMTTRETVVLTRAMLESGTTLIWPNSAIPKVDKHSTGGIGDKISLVLAPMLACCGLQVPMLSGRGLGITGGTLDKLESIRGFRTDLSTKEIVEMASRVGCVITGATNELAPADRKLYSLRDVTGSIPSEPLIVASIMSKKLVENLDALVLDVKFGSGAFMKTIDRARDLGRALVDVGTQMGVKTTALVTDMNQPLGRSVGNAIEVREAIETLQGHGPADVLELAIRLGSELLLTQKKAVNEKEAHRVQLRTITSGQAMAKFEEMVAAQGGRLGNLPLSNATMLVAKSSGYVHSVDNARLGNAVIQLGGGRHVITDTINHSVGLEILVRVGRQIETGQPLARVFADSDIEELGLDEAFVIKPAPAEKITLLHDRIH